MSKPIVRHMPCDASKSLTMKLQGTHFLTPYQIKRIAHHMPRDEDRLNALVSGISTENGEKVLGITRAHERDQAQFLECVSFLRAYAKGGKYGVYLLNIHHESIIAHFGMQEETWEALTAAGVTVNFETGRLLG